MLKIAFIPMSFLHFFAVFYKKYSDLLQVVFQCKKYSENTVGNGTRGKTVIFTADIFAVYLILEMTSAPCIIFSKFMSIHVLIASYRVSHSKD
jgi:hypothetical protein